MQPKNGSFVISLDFELMWGVRDIVTLKDYGEHLRGVQEVIPKTLSFFREYGIRATFSTVGLLFFNNKEEMLVGLPSTLPQYNDPNLSPYGNYMQQEVGDNYAADLYHFAPHLIKLIQDTPGQEIGTHTFSHYYCLENGQTIESFKCDLHAAIAVAKSKGIHITSIIFPRNQFNQNYLKACSEVGIIAYRNNERSWIYEAKNGQGESGIRRIFRLADSYINFTGHHCYDYANAVEAIPVNIPSSRFLRPYSGPMKYFESLRMRRIKKAMTHAAKNNLMYHLWWHPHNFGINQGKNFGFLIEILAHYKSLNQQYGFTSITMTSLANQILKNDAE
jgi:peptidoglycan/xylan/chitin deacetylase (PgdA/CDA1 family)